jgi:dipeptide/tripeptide permease
MLSAAVSVIVGLLVNQAEPSAQVSSSRFYHAARFIGALLIATLVPFLIDRRARRSSR